MAPLDSGACSRLLLPCSLVQRYKLAEGGTMAEAPHRAGAQSNGRLIVQCVLKATQGLELADV